MSNARGRRQPRTSDWDYRNLVPPCEMFGRDLAGKLIRDAELPFAERVERAWNYIKTAYFAVDEHDRLRAELGRLIAKEGTCE